jgi:acyl carrier protein
MDRMDALNDVFRMVFDDPDLGVTAATTANDVDGWDSLSHVNLILAIEARFKIKFTQRELLTMKNVGDLHRAIDAKLA